VTPLRIVFMGTPAFACPTLQALIDRGEEILAVVTQPDRPKGRGQQHAPPPVKELAESADLPVLQPVKVRAPEFIDSMRELAPDLIVVIAFGQILPKALLEVPRFGCINIHASLLPRWRGAAPINWCIIAGDTETGITTMQMDAGLDTGDMLLKKSITIDQDEDASSLHDRLAALGVDALAETLDLLAKGELVPVSQDDGLTCYAPMLKKEDGAIDWTKDALAIKNLVRGVTPWPGAFTGWEGKTLKVFRVSVASGEGRPGEILRADRTGLEVACGSGSLLIHELQLEGRKRLPAAEFLAGCKVAAGSLLGKDSSRE
jgi:methionyl-tRNA formyltransferase